MYKSKKGIINWLDTLVFNRERTIYFHLVLSVQLLRYYVIGWIRFRDVAWRAINLSPCFSL